MGMGSYIELFKTFRQPLIFLEGSRAIKTLAIFGNR
jgi:hypothetical protein